MKRYMKVNRKFIIFGEKNKKVKKSHKLIIIVLIIMLSLYVCFYVINEKITPVIMEYAEKEAKSLSMLIMNKAVSEVISNQIKIDDLFIIIKDNNGQVKSIDFNPIGTNKILNLTTNTVLENLKHIQNGDMDKLTFSKEILNSYNEIEHSKLKKGVIFEVPIGVISRNSLLSNLGPKIPVRINLVGEIISSIKTNVTNYGINNAIIEVSVSFKMTQRTIIPFSNKDTEIALDIPIALKIIQGSVPNYYANGLTQNSPTLAVPVE